MEAERTHFISLSEIAAAGVGDRRHCLELVSGEHIGRRHAIGPTGATCGRVAPADIVIVEAGVSRAHCRLTLHGGDLLVTDLGSTNGTFVDGVRIDAPTPIPVGAILQVGNQFLKHELLTGRQLQKSNDLDRDLAAAFAYVQALLPPPLTGAAITTDWVHRPCTKLGGDVFGYGYLSDTHFTAYLVDVSGHGAGAAMHGVAVMNLLRQRALPHTDMTRPAEVLATLNALFQMEEHADMYFTIWYGVFDLATRELAYATAGHHAAFLVAPERADATPMRTKNAMIGASLGRTYAADTVTVPPGASVYLFSDGVFEIVTATGIAWGLADFLPLILGAPLPNVTESERLYRCVCDASKSRELDDDFSLVVLTFN